MKRRFKPTTKHQNDHKTTVHISDKHLDMMQIIRQTLHMNQSELLRSALQIGFTAILQQITPKEPIDKE